MEKTRYKTCKASAPRATSSQDAASQLLEILDSPEASGKFMRGKVARSNSYVTSGRLTDVSHGLNQPADYSL